MKTAVVTGASSGIGREFVRLLAKKGFKVIAAARREQRLLELKEETDCEVFVCDLTKKADCYALYEFSKSFNPFMLINCAGFGVFGKFEASELERELSLIDLNITALHILTKLFLRDFKGRDRGVILNVSSSAGLVPAGPYMSGYYASKAYVTSLTSAIAAELKEEKSGVLVSSLCPGPVDTEFNEVAGVKFGVGSISARECAEYALKKLKEGKTVIVPSFTVKACAVGSKLAPRELVTRIAGELQKKKKQ